MKGSRGTCDVCLKNKTKVFHFPTSLTRSRRWAQILQWEREFDYIIDNDVKKVQNIRVCVRHFSSKQFENNDTAAKMLRWAEPDIPRRVILVRKAIPPPPSAARTEVKVEPQEEPEPVSTELRGLTEGYSLIEHCQLQALIDMIPGCIKCGAPVPRKASTVGTTVLVTFECKKCTNLKWTSTSPCHEDDLGSIFKGNLDIFAAAAICGIPYERLRDQCNAMKLGLPSDETFRRLTRELIYPQILEEYEACQKAVQSYLKGNNEDGERRHIDLIGNAQYDTRGYCATTCRYVMMEPDSKLIMDHAITTGNENGGNSPMLEPEAFAEAMESITQNSDFIIDSITSHANKAISSIMENNYPWCKHLLDKTQGLKISEKSCDDMMDESSSDSEESANMSVSKLTLSRCEPFNNMISSIYLNKSYPSNEATTKIMTKLAICHYNYHRLEILAIPPDSVKRKTQWSKDLRKSSNYVVNRPPTQEFKKRILVGVGNRYRSIKYDKCMSRIIGRHKKNVESSSNGDESNAQAEPVHEEPSQGIEEIYRLFIPCGNDEEKETKPNIEDDGME